MNRIIRILPLLAISLAGTAVNAQSVAVDVSRPSSAVSVPPPKVLLVRLPTFQNHIKRFTKTGQQAALTQAQMDVSNVIKYMTADFHQNFDFCPVYFFVDTNDNKIRKKQYDGIILNHNMQPVNAAAVMPKDTNFFIGYYGKYVPKPKHVKKSRTETEAPVIQNNYLRTTEHLVVLDHQFRDIPKDFIGKVHPRLADADVNYKSKYNISYRSVAKLVNRKLNQFYANYK